MTATSETVIHDVRKIELISAFPANGNSKAIRITSGNGVFEMTLFGETDALSMLPQAADFRFIEKTVAA